MVPSPSDAFRPATKSELEARGLPPKSEWLINPETGETISRVAAMKREAAAEGVAAYREAVDAPPEGDAIKAFTEELDRLARRFAAHPAIVAALEKAAAKIKAISIIPDKEKSHDSITQG